MLGMAKVTIVKADLVAELIGIAARVVRKVDDGGETKTFMDFDVEEEDIDADADIGADVGLDEKIPRVVDWSRGKGGSTGEEGTEQKGKGEGRKDHGGLKGWCSVAAKE